MEKPDLKGFSGEVLFEYYVYGSKDEDYAQTLKTAFNLIGEDLFKKLEQAEKEGKRIEVVDDPDSGDDVNDPPMKVIIK